MRKLKYFGIQVKTVEQLTGIGYSEESELERKPGTIGILTGEYHTSHGLCFEVQHCNNVAWYDATEIVLALPNFSDEQLE